MQSNLYSQHLAILKQRADAALQRAGFDHLLVPAGVVKYRYLDDMPYPFAVNAHFKAWLPLTQHPDCWLSYTPGQRPLLVYCQPDDYWHLPPAAPEGDWVEHFDIRIIREAKDAIQHLPANAARAAVLGEADAALGDYVPNNPALLLNYLHFHRATKTDYELAQMRMASTRAARGHRAAEYAFRTGASELDIHRAYCAAAGHSENDLPYGNIVALNEHGATLHYQYQQSERPAEHLALLIDAGAQVAGYAADVTRTYAAAGGEFADLIAAVEQVQLALCAKVRSGQDYAQLHLEAHQSLAGVLREQDFVRMAPAEMVESGVSNVFFPHGLGHFLGLQVHDIGGFQRDESGGSIAKPDGHPYLRLTRRLSENNVVTIEPGIYFIDSLLNGLRKGKQRAVANWDKIDRVRKFGGVRIEDNVRVTEDAPENFTRDAFVAMNAALVDAAL